MSLAEQLKQEGKLESQLEIVKRMLEAGSDLAFVLKVTGLSLDKIKSIKKH